MVKTYQKPQNSKLLTVTKPIEFMNNYQNKYSKNIAWKTLLCLHMTKLTKQGFITYKTLCTILIHICTRILTTITGKLLTQSAL